MGERGDHPGSESLALPLVDDDDRQLRLAVARAADILCDSDELATDDRAHGFTVPVVQLPHRLLEQVRPRDGAEEAPVDGQRREATEHLAHERRIRPFECGEPRPPIQSRLDLNHSDPPPRTISTIGRLPSIILTDRSC